MYQYVLAERFGCTLAELGERLSAAEYLEWSVRDGLVAEMRKRGG